MSDREFIELRNKVTNILDGDYSIYDKHTLAVRLENSSLFRKFLRAIQYGEVAKKNEDLITKVLDCLEY